MNHKLIINLAQGRTGRPFWRCHVEDEIGITIWTGPAWRYSKEMAEADGVSTGLVSVAGIENLSDGRESF